MKHEETDDHRDIDKLCWNFGSEAMHDLKLRKAMPEDSEFAYHVKKLAFKAYVEQVWGWNDHEQRQLHERRFASQDFQVIQVSGHDIGIMACVQQPDHVKINQIFLLPAYQNRGIGTACMQGILERALASGRAVQLQVLKVNGRAVAFYRRLRFACVSESDTHLVFEYRIRDARLSE